MKMSRILEISGIVLASAFSLSGHAPTTPKAVIDRYCAGSQRMGRNREAFRSKARIPRAGPGGRSLGEGGPQAAPALHAPYRPATAR